MRVTIHADEVSEAIGYWLQAHQLTETKRFRWDSEGEGHSALSITIESVETQTQTVVSSTSSSGPPVPTVADASPPVVRVVLWIDTKAGKSLTAFVFLLVVLGAVALGNRLGPWGFLAPMLAWFGIGKVIRFAVQNEGRR